MIPSFLPIEDSPMSIFTALVFLGVFMVLQNINKKISGLAKKDGALSKCMNEIKLTLKEIETFSKSHKEVIVEMKNEVRDMRKDIQRIPRT